jgi:hypothetical protein
MKTKPLADGLQYGCSKRGPVEKLSLELFLQMRG